MEKCKIKVGRRDHKNQLTIVAQIPHDINGDPINKLELLAPLSFFFLTSAIFRSANAGKENF